MRRAGKVLLAAISTTAMAMPGIAQESIPDSDWHTINRDLAATRYSPLDEINRANVDGLHEKWSYPLRSFSTAVPVVVDGIMYMPAGNRVVALNADTGEEVWAYSESSVPDQGPGIGGGGFSGRGLGYWPGDSEHAPRILVMRGNRLIAIDAATGQPVESFGESGSVDVGVPYGGTPTIAGHVAVIGAATLENPVGVPGNPRAFDVVTGAKLWEFQTVPKKGEPYNQTWGDGWEGRSGTNMWAFAAPVDLKRNVVYLPISGPAPNYYGGGRPGANVFGNSIVAVDLETGEYRWHFQTVHHDLWDTDMPTAGALIEVETKGGKEPAIAHIGKSALFYLLDRETGEPIHSVEEMPVPVGDVPGEYYHPTQPIPTVTPPLSRVSLTYADIVNPEDTTPEHAKACRDMWDAAGGYLNFGIFTPFMFHREGTPPRSTIQLPGGTGGVNWGGVAANPHTGMVYANAQHTSLVGWVERKDSTESYSFDANDTDQPYDRASVNGKGPFFTFAAPLSGEYDENNRPVGTSAPCYKPPWGELTAIDANTGEIKWQVPLGVYDELPEGKQLTGNSGSAGPTVTAGGLIFVGATNDKRFRAFDADTGRQLWEARLNNNANANPMTYRGKSGKQYVAVAAGGVVVAYALP